jgi:hypothetical protein
VTKRSTEGPASQKQAFIKVARELGCDESEERFDAALKTIAKQKPKEPEARPPKKKAAP